MWQKSRSNQKEIIDLGRDRYTQKEYIRCIKLLGRINRWLGGFRASNRVFKTLGECSSIVEVGCGGGEYCQYLHQLFPKATILGIDQCQEAIDYAMLSLPEKAKEKVFFENQKHFAPGFDVITTMLVCHHMTDEELVVFLQDCYRMSKKAVIINDLHRHLFAYIGFSLLVPFFFPSRLIWHDGRLSVKRSFRKKEWISLLKKAGFQKNQYVLRWNWAFRWTLLITK